MSSRYAASDYDSAESRPDKVLVVKCNYEGARRQITFNSSRTCTLDFLKHRVEASYSLSPTSYAITYTDDDGEVTVINTEADLTEAIRYFCPGGGDDPPLSSAASILSGRSFGRNKITLRVKITIDYDGPSLSDTSSLASTDEYQDRHDDNFSLSGSFAGDVEEDARTVSSKDTGSKPRSRYNFFRSRGTKTVVPGTCKKSRSSTQDDWDEETVSSIPKTLSLSGGGSSLPSIADHEEDAVFERLKSQEAQEHEDPQTAAQVSAALQNERGAAWLREQTARTMHILRPRNSSRLDRSEQLSVADSLSIPEDDVGSIMSGELALEQGNDGRFYYAYTSGSSVSAPTNGESEFIYAESGLDDESGVHAVDDARPSSSGSWQGASSSRPSSSSGPRHHSPSHRSYSEPILSREEISPDIPPELLPFITTPVPPPTSPTDCSSCGALLETIRYVCSTCGEKEPVNRTAANGIDINGKGKAREPESFGASTVSFMYPPSSHRTAVGTSPTVSSWTLVAENNPFDDKYASSKQKPLPALPSSPGSSPSSLTIQGIGLRSHSASSSSLSSQGPGFELCFNCIASVGVVHALEASIGPESSPLPMDLPPSPEETQRALSEWRRTASRKGHLRHAYLEKVWGPRGWDNVEHDDHTTKCSTCPSTIVGKRYKCAMCENFSLCKACYSQVHEIHPSHPFLVIVEKPARTRSEPVIEHSALTPDESGELSMTHTGVKCAHCLLEIVGARFHCAICPAIDICSNCESAGLPGNLDSSDDGHNSSHIMIKIPYPLPMQELEIASKRAKQLWGKDAATVDEEGKRARRESLGSGYARTVIGPSASALDVSSESTDGESHGTRCDVCRKMIFGVRYQCAMCPSKPQAYSLCSECEARSYAVHDPMHIFFKLPRPVDKPIEYDYALLPILYTVPAGPPGGVYLRERPKEYLQSILHSSAVCDRCMQRIHGEWFRCVYCAIDLCDNCEAVDTHNYKHFFMVFKSTVDMQRFRRFAQLDNAEATPPQPVVPHAVYTS